MKKFAIIILYACDFRVTTWCQNDAQALSSWYEINAVTWCKVNFMYVLRAALVFLKLYKSNN